MTDLQASLGLHQLARLESNLVVRQEVWRAYDAAFRGLEGLIAPEPRDSANTRHARHLYTLRLDPAALTTDRAQFAKALAAENIGSGIHYVPVHMHRWYARELGTHRGQFPVAEAIGATTLSLPLSGGMTDEDAADVIAAVTKIAKRYQRAGVSVRGWDGAAEREAA